MKLRTYRFILATISGLMLGLAFPPVPTGVTAAFAFIPFFILFESIERYGVAFRYSYLVFFIFNLLTLYWAGGYAFCKDIYQMIAGALLLLGHPFFFCVPIIAWIFIRRHLGFNISIFVFPFLWVAFEYLHSLTEISFPWLILGNTQTYDLAIIQFASFTGVYGISFWLLWLNVLGFLLIAKIISKEWKPFSNKSILLLLGILILYFLPKVYGTFILKHNSFSRYNIVHVAVIQPNIDPFEKWSGNPDEPLTRIQQQTNEVGNKSVDLVIWPETAPPFYVLHPGNRFYFDQIRSQADILNINLLTGIPDIYYYRETDVIPGSAKKSVSGQYYDTYNSSMLLRPMSEEIQKYAKIILVPFAERVPFSEALSFLNAMQWNFGLGGWAHGKDTTVFSCQTLKGEEIKFSNMICYESIYPDLVASFVRKGAQFLTVITNDSWWGNTSGAYQHKQFAILRAVENRRWVVQCANGGISFFIDPLGNIVQQTSMYERKTLFDKIEPRGQLTFYTRNGNWVADLSIMFSAIFLTAAFGNKFYNHIRKKELHAIY